MAPRCCAGGLDTPSGAVFSPGGGGGGGIIHFIAPSFTALGTSNVAGGAGGTTIPVNGSTRVSGGGGGACGGDGGQGSAVPFGASVTPANAQPGAVGYSIVTQRDPTTLLR